MLDRPFKTICYWEGFNFRHFKAPLKSPTNYQLHNLLRLHGLFVNNDPISDRSNCTPTVYYHCHLFLGTSYSGCFQTKQRNDIIKLLCLQEVYYRCSIESEIRVKNFDSFKRISRRMKYTIKKMQKTVLRQFLEWPVKVQLHCNGRNILLKHALC